MKRKRTAVLRVLGRRMKELRRERHITQTQVARAMEIHPTNVSHIEAGRQDLTITQLTRAAREFGVSICDLVAPLDHGPTVARP